MSLTIGIPTYNRNQKLYANLLRLLPNVTDEKVLVVDNGSDISVEETLKDLHIKFPHVDLKIYRNRSNIGITANFMRCFEYCSTDWLWILSDDDPIYDTALTTIHSDINRHSDFVFFNYASSMVETGYSVFTAIRDESYVTQGFNEFVLRFDSFVNTIFISSGVYNVQRVLPNLRIGYMFGYSLAPHIAMVMYSLGESGKCLFSTEKLVEFLPPADSDTWSRLAYTQVIMLLLELPTSISDNAFRVLSDKMLVWFMTDREVFTEILRVYKNSPLKGRHMFLQIIARTWLRRRSFFEKLNVLYLLAKLAFPKLLMFKSKNIGGSAKSLVARI
jgi:abequosyltransferase